MASQLTTMQAQTRSAEHHRRAELNRLHRLDAKARPSEPRARTARPSHRYLGSPARAFRWTAAHVGATYAALR